MKTTAVPLGFQLYASGMKVGRLLYQRAAAAQDFARCSEILIKLEPGPRNREHADAIKIIGISKSKRYFIGHVPRKASVRIVASGLTNDLRAQLEYISKDRRK